MTLTANIVLWSTSLFLAFSGITFGIIASVNASRANRNIKTLIADSWLSEESQKYFFENMKKTTNVNKQLIRFLTKNSPTYFEYSLKASGSRMSLMPFKLLKELQKTEYKEVTKLYLEMKTKLDGRFKEIIRDVTILQSDKTIPKPIVYKLLKLHQETSEVAASIVKAYSLISSVSQKEKLKP